MLRVAALRQVTDSDAHWLLRTLVEPRPECVADGERDHLHKRLLDPAGHVEASPTQTRTPFDEVELGGNRPRRTIAVTVRLSQHAASYLRTRGCTEARDHPCSSTSRLTSPVSAARSSTRRTLGRRSYCASLYDALAAYTEHNPSWRTQARRLSRPPRARPIQYRAYKTLTDRSSRWQRDRSRAHHHPQVRVLRRAWRHVGVRRTLALGTAGVCSLRPR